MELRRDLEAASPLVVILTVVLVAVGLTTLVFFLVVDTTATLLEIQQVEGPAFQVTDTSGDLAWGELEVVFLDRAGEDLAATFLSVPTGPVEEGDRITLRQHPPGGDYLLVVRFEGEDLARLRFQA